MKKVLIFSHQEGFESDLVIDELNQRGHPFFRFNLDDGSSVSTTSAYVGQRNSILFGSDGKTIHDHEIGVAWLQQPAPYIGQPTDDMKCLQRTSLDAMHRAALVSLSCPWFNRFDNVLLAGNKLHQLRSATSVDLPVLQTLISNHPEEIRSFCKQGVTIAKNLSTPWLEDGQQTIASYTKIVQDEWLSSDDELRFAPVIYQRFCERVRDYRVVAIGNQHFCVSCVPSAEQYEDIRRVNHTGAGYEVCELDESLSSKLALLMDRLGIDYCSADFIEDTDGNIFFLEANICGAWWWVDKYFDGAICATITDQIVGKM